MRSKRSVFRALLWTLVGILPSVLVAPVAASAAGNGPDGKGDGKGTEIASGWKILGATVTGPGLTTPRHLDGAQAAAFVQAWLPASIYGRLSPEDPPPALDVYTVDVTDTIQGNPARLIAYYASDGQSAWVSMPPQDLGGGASVSQQKWLIAPQRTIAAFEGKLAPEPVAGASTSKTAGHAAASSSPKDTASNTPLVLAFAALVLLALAAFGINLARRRRAAS